VIAGVNKRTCGACTHPANEAGSNVPETWSHAIYTGGTWFILADPEINNFYLQTNSKLVCFVSKPYLCGKLFVVKTTFKIAKTSLPFGGLFHSYSFKAAITLITLSHCSSFMPFG